MATEYERWKADEAAAYLSHVKGAQARIQTLADTIADLYDEIAGIKAVDYSQDRVDGGVVSYLLEQMLDDKQQRMDQCQTQAHDMECRVRRVTYILGRMDDQFHASILEAHYVNGDDWHTVAERANYSTQHIFRIRFDALLGFYDCMFERETDIPNAIET